MSYQNFVVLLVSLVMSLIALIIIIKLFGAMMHNLFTNSKTGAVSDFNSLAAIHPCARWLEGDCYCSVCVRDP